MCDLRPGPDGPAPAVERADRFTAAVRADPFRSLRNVLPDIGLVRGVVG